MDEALKATQAQWWETHKKSINGWLQCHKLMKFHFGEAEQYQAERYDGQNDHSDHMIACQTMWVSQPKDEWVHAFVHTLDELPRQWYVSAELHKDITTYEELSICFSHIFHFADANLFIHSALQHICDVVLKVVPIAYSMDPHATHMVQSMMEC